ncbi:MAG: carbamoyltransferase HypF [Bdellovibrionales bacterium RIFOXYB1_FULL_37_110]|nr:MAG: carbamoyltransferase HypF [Bdellovibrionales bacterium RIFOXYA1_FULL_38_20]OFZ51106.1 MAG: carbamoyltransferase HypF [Bdellovibrionales bacterium RIFOXYC1_FULL_37_79]OFZ60318.1 MAG: carbamoyltransferase HypF [Bdellovibrionales bacterium RIFOXYB1_FULL_37_110]
MQNVIRLKVIVTGIVQGVGMRPTIYRHAINSKVTGQVSNTPQGVLIEVQGNALQVAAFMEQLKNAPPPQALIENINSTHIPPLLESVGFLITESNHSGNKSTDISPDLATCPDCLKEIFDPTNRRFQYAFTNCTNCGPRFTIIKDRPYDRPLTSMNSFPMCKACSAEYHDPLNRRYHAQPNACKDCGPRLSILGMNSADPLNDTVTFLKNEKIVAIKGLGGFNIACLPYGPSLKKIRELKKRPTKSFALMAKNIFVIEKYCHVSAQENAALRSCQAPIVLLKKKEGASVLSDVSPDNNYLGCMLPYTPLHHLIMEHFDFLIMTSANEKDEPIASNDFEITQLLEKSFVDYVLTHNREIIHRADDSIIQFIRGKKQIIRRSRGIVPLPLYPQQNLSLENRLCLGANMKNTFALKAGNKIYLSQHIGELIDHRNHEFQKQEIENLMALLDIDAKKTNIDAHPGYENFNPDFKQVFHHHAHFLSVIGEHSLTPSETLGIICDGTGFGTDGNIWGFEFLKIKDDLPTFERVAHLDYFELPGSERAIYEVDRLKISLLNQSMDNLDRIAPAQRVKEILMLIDKKLNTPLTSSLGRLFDGVAAILNVASVATYEAQAAILLQKAAENNPNFQCTSYPVKIIESDLLKIDYRPMLISLMDDLKHHVSVSECAYKFHKWVVDAIMQVIQILTPTSVCLSGGCYQNRLLMEILIDKLTESKITYYTNELVPINDAGISFGQALVEEKCV